MPADPSHQLSPLAERLRPKTLDDMVGQQHLIGPNRPLRRALERGQLPSLLFWGPPGTGKTTLARLIASHIRAVFISLSAVDAGVREVRKVAEDARGRQLRKERTILFLDEVHRFNKAQQDILLPFIEDGTLTFIGATTENPSFEINPALRSRTQIYVLKALSSQELAHVIQRALDSAAGFAGQLELTSSAQDTLIAYSDGDARRALNALEAMAPLATENTLSQEVVAQALGDKGLAFDKGGEHFYNLISALHKSIRGSHPDAALYWLARMLAGGADGLYVARRLVRIASEDIGLADPNALRLSLAARDAMHFLGSPEGELALAQATVYLALAPKSNSVYSAWKQALSTARAAQEAVPLHLRNAPTALMKHQGYGSDYAYYFSDPIGSFAQNYLPEGLTDTVFYQADGEGWEGKVRQRLEELRRKRQEAQAQTSG